MVCNSTSADTGLDAPMSLASRSDLSVIYAPPMFCPVTVARAHASLTVVFADVAGNEAAKKDLEEVVDFLKHPKKYEA